jgi:hypothetical protein
MSLPAEGEPSKLLVGFDLRSVASLATRFYACVVAIGLVALAVFWVLGSIFGMVGAFEHFMQAIGFTGFRVLSLQLMIALIFLGAVWCGFMVGMTVVGAALYNVLAHRNHGVRVLIADEQSELARANGSTAETPRVAVAPRAPRSRVVARPVRVRPKV